MGQHGCGPRWENTLEGFKGSEDEEAHTVRVQFALTPTAENRLAAVEEKLDRVLDHLEGRLEHVPGIGWGRLL